MVLPVLWAAATGAAPALDAGHLGQLFAAIDIEPRALPSVDDWLPASVDGSPARSGPPAPASPQLTDLLADAIARLVGDSVARDTDTRDAGTRDAGTRDTWLTIAGTVADARINAIVSGKHRGAYARAASLAYAHAEALAGVGREAEARGYLEGVRARFPRHIAFRGEFDAAASASTLRPRRR